MKAHCHTAASRVLVFSRYSCIICATVLVLLILVLILGILTQPVQAQTTASFWTTPTIPANANASDTSPVELGVKFVSSVNGTISAIRFYKGSKNTGTHTVSLWTSLGVRLASAPSSNETASGWQTVRLNAPVGIT